MTPLVAGIDPGIGGAVAFLEGEKLTVVDMPTLQLPRGDKSKREIDAHALARLIAEHRPDHAVIERVSAMPGQGVTSMFSFGRSFGTAIGVLAALGVPFTLVSPVAWKRVMRVPRSKEGARARASQLMPQAANQWPLKRHHGRAEATLLCLLGRDQGWTL